MLFLIIFRC